MTEPTDRDREMAEAYLDVWANWRDLPGAFDLRIATATAIAAAREEGRHEGQFEEREREAIAALSCGDPPQEIADAARFRWLGTNALSIDTSNWHWIGPNEIEDLRAAIDEARK